MMPCPGQVHQGSPLHGIPWGIPPPPTPCSIISISLGHLERIPSRTLVPSLPPNPWEYPQCNVLSLFLLVIWNGLPLKSPALSEYPQSSPSTWALPDDEKKFTKCACLTLDSDREEHMTSCVLTPTVGSHTKP